MKQTIEKAFAGELDIKDKEVVSCIESVIADLDSGKVRICEKVNGEWTVNEWLKKAVLLFFRIKDMKIIESGDINYYDKIPLKKWTGKEGVRVVPQAVARYGAFLEPGTIMMPSYVNIGAYVGSGTMVDTWATVGSCAQIGKNVHLSGGVGIGGVLEPVQASPVIIEDNVFVGSRCIVVEGAVIEDSAVLGAGVTITASTHVIDVTSEKEVVYKGRVPKNSVVIPGTRVKDFPAGSYGVPCALIIGKRSEKTDSKTSLTDVLREFNLPV